MRREVPTLCILLRREAVASFLFWHLQENRDYYGQSYGESIDTYNEETNDYGDW